MNNVLQFKLWIESTTMGYAIQCKESGSPVVSCLPLFIHNNRAIVVMKLEQIIQKISPVHFKLVEQASVYGPPYYIYEPTEPLFNMLLSLTKNT